MMTRERLYWLLGIATFYLGSLLIATQVGAAREAALATDAFEEAEYQTRLALGYRDVIVRGTNGTEASLAVCMLARAELRAQIAARRPAVEWEVDLP